MAIIKVHKKNTHSNNFLRGRLKSTTLKSTWNRRKINKAHTRNTRQPAATLVKCRPWFFFLIATFLSSAKQNTTWHNLSSQRFFFRPKLSTFLQLPEEARWIGEPAEWRKKKEKKNQQECQRFLNEDSFVWRRKNCRLKSDSTMGTLDNRWSLPWGNHLHSTPFTMCRGIFPCLRHLKRLR